MVSAGVNYGLDLAADIAELKRERNAVILAHNYQVREIQEVADFVGDSLGLSYQAAKTDAEKGSLVVGRAVTATGRGGLGDVSSA